MYGWCVGSETTMHHATEKTNSRKMNRFFGDFIAPVIHVGGMIRVRD